MVILDIFASRANTSEGKIQVEMAQLKYRMTRLSGLGTTLSRLGRRNRNKRSRREEDRD